MDRSTSQEWDLIARERWVIEWGKLILLSTALVFGFVLVIVAIVTMQPDDPRFIATFGLGTTTTGTIIGYVTGNGRLASKGQPPVPTLSRPSRRKV